MYVNVHGSISYSSSLDHQIPCPVIHTQQLTISNSCNQQLMQSATTYMDHSSISPHPLPAQIQWRSCFLRSEVFLVHLSAPS